MEPFFFQGKHGRLFGVLFSPDDSATRDRVVLHVPAFAEEMNKSRPMVAKFSRLLADRGIASLIVDCMGTGDSEGQFHDAGWRVWVDDVSSALAWLRDQGFQRFSICANRTGASLAIDALHDADLTVDDFICWQPVPKGSAYLRQFLRLRRAAEIFQTEEAETSDDNWPLEVAGYTLTRARSEALESIDLPSAIPKCQRACIVEVSALPEPKLSRPCANLQQAWQDQGVDVRSVAVSGEPFWSTLETSINDAVLRKSTEFLADG